MARESILQSQDNAAVRTRPTRLRRGRSPLWGPFTISEAPGRRAAQSRDALYRRSLAGADLLSAALAALFAIPLLGDDTLAPVSALALPLVVVFSKLIGL